MGETAETRKPSEGRAKEEGSGRVEAGRASKNEHVAWHTQRKSSSTTTSHAYDDEVLQPLAVASHGTSFY